MSSLRRFLLATAVAILALSTGALAVTQHKATKTKTFKLRTQSKKVYSVAYPFALKYANAKYSCKVKKLQPVKIPAGDTKPELGQVKIIAKGPAVGGSGCLVMVQNKNDPGTAAVRIRITTTTRWAA